MRCLEEMNDSQVNEALVKTREGQAPPCWGAEF